ncbi:MAG: hypothetical protein L0Y71_06210 [Gemmataceae bacterium]|nr:hypothetical protein [Gemmataceae bacterium]
MSKAGYVACAVATLALCLSTARTQTPAPPRQVDKGPDIGFDYRAFIAEHQELINSGQVEKAVDHLKSRAKYPKAFAKLDEPFRKVFAGIFSRYGKPDGFELVGYKRYSSRQYQFFVMAYYENGSIQFNYGLERWRDEWKWIQFGTQNNVDEIGKGIPFQPIEGK